ncbi:MAG: hydantoinase B/oxoprolinase family protein, partial [Actinobacteria bacterium]|nr:hydantoinase B/oxoprolinase family protein [Actinomycetota bacterium]
VSRDGAAAGYGVVIIGPADAPAADEEATRALRAARRAARPARRPFFDRGPGYQRLSGGAAAAEVDWL